MKTNIQETSLMAYFGEIVINLAPRHKEIVNIFKENTSMDFTNRELLRELRREDPIREINSVTPRVHELRGHGKNNPFRDHPYLILSRKRECDVTKRIAYAWQLNNK